mmetsp:Transcript_41296/g.113884  ORF Transcript_41296/g.113884 Transcript_41296/m.113884 type:complete len:157 (-) Transcript_41296:38-508(-)
MGAAGTRRPPEEEDEVGWQDEVYPWFHLVQWCAEDANQGVFTWDIDAIKTSVGSLATNVDTFLESCPTELPASCPRVSVAEDTTLAYMEWAEALLHWSPELRQVRFTLVPKRMKEAVFWSRYFASVRHTVQKLLFHDEIEEETSSTPGSLKRGVAG